MLFLLTNFSFHFPTFSRGVRIRISRKNTALRLRFPRTPGENLEKRDQANTMQTIRSTLPLAANAKCERQDKKTRVDHKCCQFVSLIEFRMFQSEAIILRVNSDARLGKREKK